MRPGERVGRYLVVIDVDGLRHAIAQTAVQAVCEVAEGGTVMLLPGGKVVRLDADLEAVLAWLNG